MCSCILLCVSKIHFLVENPCLCARTKLWSVCGCAPIQSECKCAGGWVRLHGSAVSGLDSVVCGDCRFNSVKPTQSPLRCKKLFSLLEKLPPSDWLSRPDRNFTTLEKIPKHQEILATFCVKKKMYCLFWLKNKAHYFAIFFCFSATCTLSVLLFFCF